MNRFESSDGRLPATQTSIVDVTNSGERSASFDVLSPRQNRWSVATIIRPYKLLVREAGARFGMSSEPESGREGIIHIAARRTESLWHENLAILTPTLPSLVAGSFSGD